MKSGLMSFFCITFSTLAQSNLNACQLLNNIPWVKLWTFSLISWRVSL